jgi:glycosyltransferase involved in cell wall biosynthesis
MLKVLSLHWGLSIGGVGKYAVLLEGVERHAAAEVWSLCILNKERQIDQSTLDALQHKTIIWRNSSLDLSWMKLARDAIERYEPDLIMSHGFNGHFIVSILKQIFGLDIPSVCSYHGEYHPTTRARKLVGSIYDFYTVNHIRKRVVSVVAVADYCRGHLTAKNVSSEAIKVIHNGIDATVGYRRR